MSEVLICPACGAVNPAGFKFCGQCAAPLAKAAEPRFGSPESYTPKHLADQILTSRSALEGERKLVTTLFADLTGFTARETLGAPKHAIPSTRAATVLCGRSNIRNALPSERAKPAHIRVP